MTDLKELTDLTGLTYLTEFTDLTDLTGMTWKNWLIWLIWQEWLERTDWFDWTDSFERTDQIRQNLQIWLIWRNWLIQRNQFDRTDRSDKSRLMWRRGQASCRSSGSVHKNLQKNQRRRKTSVWWWSVGTHTPKPAIGDSGTDSSGAAKIINVFVIFGCSRLATSEARFLDLWCEGLFILLVLCGSVESGFACSCNSVERVVVFIPDCRCFGI